MSRYGKRAGLIVYEDEPFNVETCSAALAEDAVTATDAFYGRGHGAVPEVDPREWHLRVHGLGSAYRVRRAPGTVPLARA